MRTCLWNTEIDVLKVALQKTFCAAVLKIIFNETPNYTYISSFARSGKFLVFFLSFQEVKKIFPPLFFVPFVLIHIYLLIVKDTIIYDSKVRSHQK